MSPIALDKNKPEDAIADPIADLKAMAAREPLPQYPDPVAPDFMYDFKYNHPLPTHGAEGIEAPKDTDATSVATETVEKLGKVLTAGDAEGFANLFMEHGVWRDRVAFTWDYRTFNFRSAILKAAKDLFPGTKVTKVELIAPGATVERPYPDLSFVQAHVGITTDILGASAIMNLILTANGWKIWTLNTVIERLNDFPELASKDGHMVGPRSWSAQRALDNELVDVEPDVLIIGGGQNGLMTAHRLKALGVRALVVERNARVGDNWRGRYEALSLHFPHWADHFADFPYPRHWPTYTPAEKLADFFEWYVSAMELPVWTSSTVSACTQANGEWTIEVTRADGRKRTFHPKQVIMATSLCGVPYIPTIKGQKDFRGVVYHSTTHTTARNYLGKRVLVVGTSSSGFDAAYDFARAGIDVTLLQRSPTFIMSLTHSVPRIIGTYEPAADGTRPDIEIADRIANSMPLGPGEEMGRRLGAELADLDHNLLLALEKRGFRTWRGQRNTATQTLGFTRNGGFYFDAGACDQIINGNIKVQQGSITKFTPTGVVFSDGHAEDFDVVVLATGFSNTIDSVRRTLGDDVARRCKPIWGMDEEGELNSAWRDCGVDNLWIVVGTLQHARYHSRTVALRIKARLEGIAKEPYLV